MQTDWTTTSDRADAYLRRQAAWSQLLQLFRDRRPTTEELELVSTLAEVGIDQVFGAYRLSEAEQLARHGAVRDFAEASALYGFVMGLAMGRKHALADAAAQPSFD